MVKGKIKNQTVKKSFTIVIYDQYGQEIDRQTVEAENAREAVCKAYPFIQN